MLGSMLIMLMSALCFNVLDGGSDGVCEHELFEGLHKHPVVQLNGHLGALLLDLGELGAVDSARR
jgi:hypothetical protein